MVDCALSLNEQICNNAFDKIVPNIDNAYVEYYDKLNIYMHINNMNMSKWKQRLIYLDLHLVF